MQDIKILNNSKDIEISLFLDDIKVKLENEIEKPIEAVKEKSAENTQSGEITIALEVAKIVLPAFLTALLFWVKQRKTYSLEYDDEETGSKIKISELSEKEFNKKMLEIKDKKTKLTFQIIRV